MEQNTKVSILVPFYNVEKYVGRCVESLFSQTYQNIEYIFVNDCTPDNSLEIINQYIDKYKKRDNCKIISHSQNQGICASRNDCLDNAIGDYILFIDSDDYIDQDMVELLVEAAIKANADISGCGYIEEYNDHSVPIAQKYTNNYNEMLKAITVLTLKGVMWKLLIKRSIIENNNIRFMPDKNMVDDYLFCCQVFYYSHRFTGVDKCMYHYIQFNPNNYSQRTFYNINHQAEAIRETENFYKEKGVYDIVKKELYLRKFIAKKALLLDKKCVDVKKWREIFPESNDAWKELDFSRGNQYIFRLAQSPFYWLIPIINYFR
ncbi:MAG: glycosyltransferase family 2 protein [Prevotella sp.]|nr:glycosyltransferase family 2 protein [Prevotella sp.]